RIAGVIIGPQQPGVVLITTCPPSATGPSIGTSGPRSPSVKVSMKTVWRAWMSTVAIVTLLGSRPGAPGHGYEQSHLVALAQRALAPGVRAGDDRQGGRERGREAWLLGGQGVEQAGDGGRLRHVEREHRRLREAAQSGPETHPHAHAPSCPERSGNNGCRHA